MANTEVSVEHELMTLLARTRPDDAATARAADLVAGPVDWDFVVDLARRHGVIPQLHLQVNDRLRDVVPATAQQRLLQLRTASAQQALHLTGALVKVLDAFEAHGVRAIPYKGPALARQLYGDVAMRQFGDIDVLVRPADVATATAVLEAVGYRAAELTPGREAMLLRGDKHRQFTRAGSLLELHWSLAKSSQPEWISIDELSERTVPLSIGRHTVRVPGPDDLLPILCLHGAKHAWERLVWLADVAAVLEAGTIDWAALLDAVRRRRFRRVLFVGLRSAAELLGAPLPEAVREEARADRKTAALVRIVADHVLGRARRHPDQARFYYRSVEGWRHRLRMAAAGLVSVGPADWEAVSLPDSLRWAYYLVRPVRLTGRFVIGPWFRPRL